MAADILAYKATHVPVGEDQKQHLELTRDIAQKFNNDFGVEFFPLVEPLIQDEAARVMSLRDGRNKMSKSDPSDNSRINMTDDADTVARKIRRARTDPEPVPDGSDAGGDRETRPEAFNLLEIYAVLAERPLADVLSEYGGRPFSEFKEALTELAVEKLGPIGDEMKRLMDDPGHVDAVLSEGGRRARAIAEPVMKELYDIIGFLRD
jgi:tryptophanyl-tRNA synthetase